MNTKVRCRCLFSAQSGTAAFGDAEDMHAKATTTTAAVPLPFSPHCVLRVQTGPGLYRNAAYGQVALAATSARLDAVLGVESAFLTSGMAARGMRHQPTHEAGAAPCTDLAKRGARAVQCIR